MNMTAVSLFAGIGGFELAMTRSGIQPVASVEIDKKASGVLAERFPNTAIFGDIKGVTSGDLLGAGFNPANGIITGGFPCQDLSVAGRRAGLAGERSGLFWEIHRLIAETKTKWFVLENVPGLLSSNDGRDMGIVLGSLAELGYGLAYRVLDAQHFGVAQRRRRVFIVGRLGDDWRTPAKILDIGEGRRGYHQKSIAQGEGTPSEADASTGERGVQPYVKVVRSGERDADGNLPAEVWAERSTAPTLNLMDNGGESRATVIVFNPHKEDGARVQGEVINTLTALMGTGGNNVPMLTAPPTIRRLTPTECERLQGFPDGWTLTSNGQPQADSSRYKQTGNAVAVPVVQWILERIVASES
jgi:DNA (cytosine-5)-methyltransferase 1